MLKQQKQKTRINKGDTVMVITGKEKTNEVTDVSH